MARKPRENQPRKTPAPRLVEFPKAHRETLGLAALDLVGGAMAADPKWARMILKLRDNMGAEPFCEVCFQNVAPQRATELRGADGSIWLGATCAKFLPALLEEIQQRSEEEGQ